MKNIIAIFESGTLARAYWKGEGPGDSEDETLFEERVKIIDEL